MKTKTTITVETYKFSSVRQKRSEHVVTCATCGNVISITDKSSMCQCQTKFRRELALKTPKGELK